MSITRAELARRLAELSEEQTIEIRQRIADNQTPHQIMKATGVPLRLINAVMIVDAEEAPAAQVEETPVIEAIATPRPRVLRNFDPERKTVKAARKAALRNKRRNKRPLWTIA